MQWYPGDKNELDEQVGKFLSKRTRNPPEKINGLIVPHAGYEFSGAIAGKAFALLKKQKANKAVIIAPSHYLALNGIITSNLKEWYTPLGGINVFNEGFAEGDIQKEHSIDNQIPFLQKLKFKEVLPLMTGTISEMQAVSIAEKLARIKDAVYIFSTDLSHFQPYDISIAKDKLTISIIENLNLENFKSIDACGAYPLQVLMQLCKINNWKPHLLEYKNSGDITGEKSSVVGYASLWF